MSELVVGNVNFGPSEASGVGGGSTHTQGVLEMAMVSRAEYEKWVKDSADLEKIKEIANSDSAGGFEVSQKWEEIFKILRA